MYYVFEWVGEHACYMQRSIGIKEKSEAEWFKRKTVEREPGIDLIVCEVVG